MCGLIQDRLLAKAGAAELYQIEQALARHAPT
jgi:hypothetical protein